MGRSFKKVATIIGIAALGFATVGMGFGLLGGGTLFGASSVLGMTTGLTGAMTLGTIASLGVLALSIGSMPGPPVEETGANERGTVFADPDALGCYVFGTTTVQSAVVYEELTGASPDRLLHDVYAHAWHRIESYEALYIASDDGSELVTFSGNTATGDHADMLYWFRAIGTQVAALSGAPFNDNGWPSTAIFEGQAHSAIVWNIDDDGFKEKFAAVPTKIDIVVEGAWLYDPRLDTGAGGSGSQDFGTPSSWGFNNGNSILVLLRKMIGEYADGVLVWGRGIAETEYDIANFMAMATIADETVDGIPRSRLGGMFMLNGSFDDFVARWEAETGGKLSKSGGIYRVWIPHDDLTALTTINESSLRAGYPVTFSAGAIDGLYNTARGRYIEPDEGYRAFPYPEVSESSAVTEDGSQRILYHDFSWVQDVSIAERVARIKVRRSRFQRMWTVTLGWAGFGPNYRPFTIHTLNLPETGGDNQLVRVVSRELDPMTGIATLTLQQEDESIYDDTIPLSDPHASATIPSRLSPYDAITPRYIDGTIISRDASVMHDEFEYVNAAALHRRWTRRDGGLPDAQISLLTGLTDAPGGQAVRFGDGSGNDEWWGAFTEFLIPYDPNETWEVGVFMRHVSGAGTVACGFEGVAADGVTMVNVTGANSFGSQHYVAANVFAFGSGAWHSLRGYVRGHGSTPTLPANDPSSPSVMRTNVAFIRPMLLLNYDNQGGVMDVALVWVRKLPTVGTPNIGANSVDKLFVSTFAGPGTHSTNSGDVTQFVPAQDHAYTALVTVTGDFYEANTSTGAPQPTLDAKRRDSPGPGGDVSSGNTVTVNNYTVTPNNLYERLTLQGQFSCSAGQAYFFGYEWVNDDGTNNPITWKNVQIQVAAVFK